MDEIGIVTMKLLLAAAAGLVLGLEREAKHKPLGLKTCVVIAIASCLLTIISIETAQNAYQGTVFNRADPMRLAAQIVSGVGFLGAGVILRNDSNVITGLTTAAIVWSAAGFGIGIGAGYYLEVAIGVTLVFFAVSFLPFIVRKIGPSSLKGHETSLSVTVENTVKIDQMINKIKEHVITIENVHVKGDKHSQQINMRCFVDDKQGNVFSQYDEIRKINGVIQVEITEL
ncbi:MAG TPA: MgtC/SapB family protein [Pseudogracilibacillus sp.]|nr:MgtC/SapB family protein [Pseudogracilibacillus sp.]